jgi:NADH dehydrogenase
MVNILITGGNGYIGAHTVKELVNKGHTVNALIKTGTDLNPVKGLPVKIIMGNLLNSDDIEEAIQGCNVVLHLAGLVGSASEKDNLSINYNGVSTLIKVCKKNKIKHLIFTSSISAVRKKVGPYGRSKQMAENLIINSGIDYTIFRPTMVYGNGSIGFKKIIKNINKFPLFIPIIGKGNNFRQPIYVKDMAKLLVCSISKYDARNKIYNTAGREKIEFRQLVKLVAQKMHKDKIFISIPVFICKIFARIFELTMKEPFFTRENIRSLGEDTMPDIKDMMADLNVRLTPLETGLNETIEDIKLSHR